MGLMICVVVIASVYLLSTANITINHTYKTIYPDVVNAPKETEPTKVDKVPTFDDILKEINEIGGIEYGEDFND